MTEDVGSDVDRNQRQQEAREIRRQGEAAQRSRESASEIVGTERAAYARVSGEVSDSVDRNEDQQEAREERRRQEAAESEEPPERGGKIDVFA